MKKLYIIGLLLAIHLAFSQDKPKKDFEKSISKSVIKKDYPTLLIIYDFKSQTYLTNLFRVDNHPDFYRISTGHSS